MSDLLSAAPAMPNASAPLPHVITAGQPSAADFRALAAAGVKTVLDLRLPMEPRPFDQPALMEELGLEYVVVPVQGMVDDAAFDKVRAVLKTASAEKPLLFHCGSANRVGGMMLPYLMLDLGQPQEAAIRAVQQVGLRDGMLAQQALTYVQRNG